MLPLSHDEVVHGKYSLIDKMPGDWWRKRAQLRLMLGYQIAVPGRKLLFQGGEFGQGREFAWDRTVDWNEAVEPERRGITAFLSRCLELYRVEPALFRRDDHRDGFHWTDHTNSAESIVAFIRRAPDARDILIVCNFTPVPRPGYRLGVPMVGRWELLVSSDDEAFGGSGVGMGSHAASVAESHHELPASFHWDLPPLGICFFRAPIAQAVK